MRSALSWSNGDGAIESLDMIGIKEYRNLRVLILGSMAAASSVLYMVANLARFLPQGGFLGSRVHEVAPFVGLPAGVYITHCVHYRPLSPPYSPSTATHQ